MKKWLNWKKAGTEPGGFAGWSDDPVLRGSYSESRSSGLDWGLVWLVAAILCFGIVMVYSASISLADNPKYHTTQTHFLFRHLFSIGLGVIAASMVYCIPMRAWKLLAKPLLIVAICLLIFVLVPGIGKSVNGARRWIDLGIMNVQVTEFVKFVACLWAAWFTVKQQNYMHSLTKGLLPMGVVLCSFSILISMQPDLGAIMVIAAISLGVLFLGGLNLKLFFVVSFLMVAAVALIIVDSPWRMQRLMAYLDPWDADYALNKGYQLSHSLIAFGRGEFSGVGLGASIEKLNYLPEAHTDFILAVIGEELGFIGVFGLYVLFYILVRRAFSIGRQAIKLDRVFSGLVAQGVGIWIGVQVVINGGVATGLLPTKGLTLPLVSYGGSSMLFTMAAIALLLRVDMENRMLMRGGRV